MMRLLNICVIAALVLAAGRYLGVELQEVGVVAVQQARHAGGALTTEAPSPPRT